MCGVCVGGGGGGRRDNRALKDYCHTILLGTDRRG